MNSTLKRSLSGAIFLVVIIGSLLLNPILFAGVLLFSILMMLKEFHGMIFGNSSKIGRYLVVVTSFVLFLLFYLQSRYGINPDLFWVLAFLGAAIIISSLYEENNDSSYLIYSIIYISLPFSLLPTILFTPDKVYNPYPLLSLFLILWSSDVGAYITGMTFGQKNGNKLFPSVSPKKSWEGFFGGALFALIAAFVIHFSTLLNFPLIHTIALSLIVFLFGVFGDLAESLIKRIFGVKDSGTIMPGHGGLLDRFDGALLAFPAAMAYLKIFELL